MDFLKNALVEVRSNDYLSGDSIDIFGRILADHHSQFLPLSVYVMGALETVKAVPRGSKHVQIMPLQCYAEADVVGHWICTYFDGSAVRVFDSLNKGSLTTEQGEFLLRLYPQKPSVKFEAVQQQPNGIDCGVFAIAFATSIACGRNPCDETYDVEKMRNHLANMLENSILLPFPLQENTIPVGNVPFCKPCYVLIENICMEHGSLVNPPPISVDQKKKAGRPKKVKRGRKKFSDKARKEVVLDAARKYQVSHPQVHRDAVVRYSQSHPEVHREAVTRYSQSHPEVHRDAVKKHYDQNRDEIVRTKRISRALPDDLNSKRVKRHISPELRADYSEDSTGLIDNFLSTLSTGAFANELLPSVQAVARISKCIADREGADLDTVSLISLKKVSLIGNDASKCPHCKAPLFFEETGRAMWCCRKGDLCVDKIPPLDAGFYSNREFLKHVRAYNNMFAFSALGTTHGFKNPTSGVSFVKVQGRIYHRIFDLSYSDSINNTALYIDDGEERLRIATDRKLNPSIIQSVERHLKEVNPLVNSFKMLSRHPSENAHLVFQVTNRARDGPILGDMPTSREISALLKVDAQCNPRQIAVWRIGQNKPHNVHYMHPTYEPLQYPMLFPRATKGFSGDVEDKKGNKITQLKFYRHRYLSDDRFTTLGRLGQEYIVDMWCKTEEERLQFLKHNQSTIRRVATRREIDETIAADGPNIQPGKIFLPASYTGSPRYMLNKYLDSMAVVSRLGQPNFFLTVTCNPQWKEIQESLLPHQQATDRPDLCDRVFKLKLAKLLAMIRSGELFGPLVSIQHVIEFQKRGLPHAHIVLRVSGCGPVNGLDIDSFVRATIPSADEAGGRLRRLVLQHMVHGPCGVQHMSCPCMNKDTRVCSKRFPKPYNETTHIEDNGFVKYRRPECGEEVVLANGRRVTNQWIVPYNPAVLLLLECHCNLEIASSAKVIKYLYKYLHKGPDHAKVAVTDNIRSQDEIENYVNFRYVSASEALWRIFEFDLCCCFPPVIALPVHLPSEDSIVFQPGEEREATERSTSKLQLYMDRPQSPEFSQLSYLDFYEQYILDTKSKRTSIPHPNGTHFISKRVRGRCVARIHFVSPSAGEVFFLRLLLFRFPCTGFEDIRTVNGVTYTTFQEAANAHGLLDNEREYFDCLQEAVAFKTGKQLRRLFFVVIISGAPALLLWDKFRDVLCEDLLMRFPDNPEKAHAHALCEIDRMLRMHGRTLRDMGLPEFPDDSTEVGREELRWSVSSCRDYVQQWEHQLTAEQRKVYDYVNWLLTSMSHNMTKVLFIDGPAGTGKTILLNTITAKLRGDGHIVLCTASTGIAALNHMGGVTAHSMFKLPLDAQNPFAIWSVSASSQRAELIRQAAVILYDEAPMAHKGTVECLDRGLRDICMSTQPFGGKILLFAGDFRQIPPIIPNSTSSDVVAASLRNSRLWPCMKKFPLALPQRSRDDPEYASFILNIGEGKIPSLVIGDTKCIKLNGILSETSLDSLLEYVFPKEILEDPSKCCTRAVLSCTNASIKEVNDIIFEKLPGQTHHLLSADSSVVNNEADVAQFLGTEVLNQISHAGVPDHEIKLKVGAVVILIRNLSFADGLVNGVKLVVMAISNILVHVRFPTSSAVHLIPRICFKFTVEHSGLEVLRRQFPFKLAYGLTINKSQGQTLDCVGLDLRTDVFSHGQLYVALGRVRNRNAIRVLVNAERMIGDVAYAPNIVFNGLFG